MADRACLLARGDLDHVVAHEVAGAMREGKAATGVIAVPAAGLQRDQVMAKIEMNGDAFPFRPFAIGIEQKRLRLAR